MREILFRGKRIDNGEWIYGSIRQENGAAYILEPNFSILFERPDRPYLECGVEDKGLTGDGYNAAWYGWEEALERYEQHFPEWIEIDPETVGQFTGLLDRNQQRIFEGDIVKFPDVVNCYISFSRGAFIVGNICPLKPLEERITDYGMCEVIGNVTDNPELLEVNNAGLWADSSGGQVVC